MAAPYCTSSSSKEKERQNPDRGHLGESQGSEWGSLTPPPTARGIRRARSCATPSLVRRGELACLPAAAWGMGNGTCTSIWQKRPCSACATTSEQGLAWLERKKKKGDEQIGSMGEGGRGVVCCAGQGHGSQVG